MLASVVVDLMLGQRGLRGTSGDQLLHLDHNPAQRIYLLFFFFERSEPYIYIIYITLIKYKLCIVTKGGTCIIYL
jgi:hypothetical protein